MGASPRAGGKASNEVTINRMEEARLLPSPRAHPRSPCTPILRRAPPGFCHCVCFSRITDRKLRWFDFSLDDVQALKLYEGYLGDSQVRREGGRGAHSPPDYGEPPGAV